MHVTLILIEQGLKLNRVNNKHLNDLVFYLLYIVFILLITLWLFVNAPYPHPVLMMSSIGLLYVALYMIKKEYIISYEKLFNKEIIYYGIPVIFMELGYWTGLSHNDLVVVYFHLSIKFMAISVISWLCWLSCLLFMTYFSIKVLINLNNNIELNKIAYLRKYSIFSNLQNNRHTIVKYFMEKGEVPDYWQKYEKYNNYYQYSLLIMLLGFILNQMIVWGILFIRYLIHLN